MSFCNFSSMVNVNHSIEIENVFFADYLPEAKPEYVKVYLYGLYMCSLGNNAMNTIETFSAKLGINESDILASFMYWQDFGLVKVIEIEPFEVKYIPITRKSALANKNLPQKYTGFCESLQEIISKSELTTFAISQVLEYMERSALEQGAFLMIAKYCVESKSKSSYSYIIATAKDWERNGIATIKDVETELQRRELLNDQLMLVLREMKLRRKPTFEEVDIWRHYTEKLGFEFNFIMKVAKLIPITITNRFTYLCRKLDKFHSLRIFDIEQVDDIENLDAIYKETALSIVRNMGLYYQSVDSIIETYISKWFNYGYSKDAIVALSSYCFQNSIRTLKIMDEKIDDLFKQGIIDDISVNEFVESRKLVDQKIRELFAKLGIIRAVSNNDRELFNAWNYTYNIGADIMEYAVGQAKNKYMAMQFLGKMLAYFHSHNITELEEAKKCKIGEGINNRSISSTTPEKKFKTRSYSDKSFENLYTDIDKINM